MQVSGRSASGPDRRNPLNRRLGGRRGFEQTEICWDRHWTLRHHVPGHANEATRRHTPDDLICQWMLATCAIKRPGNTVVQKSWLVLRCGPCTVRGGADKSLARPTSRCRRTELIVSLERGVCSCAELQAFSCYRDWKEACQ